MQNVRRIPTQAGFSDGESIGSPRKGRHRGSSNTLKSNIKSSISQNSSNSDLSDNGSAERSKNSSESIENTVREIGTVKTYSHGLGTIATGDHEDIPFHAIINMNVGSTVYFQREFISGKLCDTSLAGVMG